MNYEEKHLIKVIGKPKEILKNSLGGWLAIWDLTTAQVLNAFKNNKDYKVIKLYSPYWKIGYIPDDRAFLNIANRQNKRYTISVSSEFKGGL